MIGCAHRECRRRATHHLGFRCWAQARPKTDGNAYTGTVTLCLCREHANEAAAKPHDTISEEGWQQLLGALMAGGGAPPDFTTAELFVVPGIPRSVLRRVAN